jgi:hypothetical protein
MPTSTFDITTNANDGRANGAALQISPGSAPNYYIFMYNPNTASATQAAWFRFTGITIPQGATINSADFKVYGMGFGKDVLFKLDSRQTPGNPTNGTQVHAPANVEGAVTANFPLGSFTNPATYALRTLDFTSIVQNLVNSHDYSNGEMVFYANSALATTTSYPSSWANYLYDSKWGSTRSAELVINYEVSASREPDRTTYRYG